MCKNDVFDVGLESVPPFAFPVQFREAQLERKLDEYSDMQG